jgi:capsular polysaccharide transport system permease protein
MNVMTKEDRALREARRAAERNRRLRMIGLGIIIPALISLVYYAFIARERYTAHMRFTIQGIEAQQPDVLSTLGIPAQSTRTSDANIIVQYVHSPEMVRSLRRSFGFDKAYSGFTFDPVGYVPPNSSVERAEDFWTGQSSAAYDTASNVITVNVVAFSPQDALRLSQGVLAEAETLVNALNSKVRNEATHVAERELASKKADYDAAKQRVAQLRASKSLTLDAETQQQVNLASGFEGQLAQLRVDRAASQATYLPGSPQMKAIDEKIAALEGERARVMAKLIAGPGSGEANRDISAQTALLDYEFAQKAYYAAVQALQSTISTRNNERRYLVAFVPPRLPEQSDYWARFANVIAVGVIAGVLMAVGMLTLSIVKDHMQ